MTIRDVFVKGLVRLAWAESSEMPPSPRQTPYNCINELMKNTPDTLFRFYAEEQQHRPRLLLKHFVTQLNKRGPHDFLFYFCLPIWEIASVTSILNSRFSKSKDMTFAALLQIFSASKIFVIFPPCCQWSSCKEIIWKGIGGPRKFLFQITCSCPLLRCWKSFKKLCKQWV